MVRSNISWSDSKKFRLGCQFLGFMANIGQIEVGLVCFCYGRLVLRKLKLGKSFSGFCGQGKAFSGFHVLRHLSIKCGFWRLFNSPANPVHSNISNSPLRGEF